MPPQPGQIRRSAAAVGRSMRAGAPKIFTGSRQREKERAREGQKEQESKKERQRQRGVIVRTRWQPSDHQAILLLRLGHSVIVWWPIVYTTCALPVPSTPTHYFLRNKPTTAHTPMRHASCLSTYIYPRDSAGNKCPATHGRRPGPRGVCVGGGRRLQLCDCIDSTLIGTPIRRRKGLWACCW